MSLLRSSAPIAAEESPVLFTVLRARAIVRLDALVTVPRTQEVRSNICNLATGLAIIAPPHVPGTSPPLEIEILSRHFLAELGIPVAPDRIAEFAAEMRALGH